LLKQQHRIKRATGYAFYLHSQDYKIEYQVTLTNQDDQAHNTHIIIPSAPHTSSQHPTSIEIHEKGELKKEKIYNNQYFELAVKLRPHEKKVITTKFCIHATPIQTPFDSLEPKKSTLSNSRFILNDSRIKSIIQSQIKNTYSSGEKIKQLYNYVKNRLSYGNPISGLYTPNQALSLDCVDCGGFVTLLCSLLHSVDIECYPVFGFFAGYKKNTMHAWIEVPLENGDVFPLDPSSDKLFDEGRSFKSGGLGWVGSDRIIFSKGSDFPLSINTSSAQIDILQNAFCYPANDKLTLETNLHTTRT